MLVEREHRSVVGDDVILERVLLKLSSNAATFCRLVIFRQYATEYIITRIHIYKFSTYRRSRKAELLSVVELLVKT